MKREIPKLQVLCLRSVGSHSCSAEETFAYNHETGEPSRASQLLRKFHKRPVVVLDDDEDELASLVPSPSATGEQQQQADEPNSIDNVPMARTPAIGKGASRRALVNEVDLNHPLVAHNSLTVNNNKPNNNDKKDEEEEETDTTATATDTKSSESKTLLVMEYGNPALDCLQSYIDSLVELGRMDDGRLGIHFFEEWKANVLVAAGKPVENPKPKIKKKNSNDEVEPNNDDNNNDGDDDAPTSPPPRKRSRRRSSGAGSAAEAAAATAAAAAPSSTTTLKLSIKQGPPPPLGSLSLNNCALAEETIEAMRESNMGIHIGVLDLTGIYQLNDTMLEQLLPHCPNLQRLSIKNCRRLTSASLQILVQYQTKLQCLDIGGTYNITPQQVVDILIIGEGGQGGRNNKSKPCPELVELHASGLGWNDSLVKTLVHGTYNTDDDNDSDEDEDGRQVSPVRTWKALSLGFSLSLTPLALRYSLGKISDTLISLALHFSETVVDNALMGILGRNLPNVRYLDVRGNPSLNSLTGWYDGRLSADDAAAVQELMVLARFTGISKNSLEDTLRIHPVQAEKLTCILDGGGQGIGIFR